MTNLPFPTVKDGELVIPGFPHRVRAEIDAETGALWVLAGDLAKVFGHREAFDLCKSVPRSLIGTRVVQTPGGPQPMLWLHEAGLYTVIARSDKVPAARLLVWLAERLLPAVRQAHAAPVTCPDIALDLLGRWATAAAPADRLAVAARVLQLLSA